MNHPVYNPMYNNLCTSHCVYISPCILQPRYKHATSFCMFPLLCITLYTTAYDYHNVCTKFLLLVRSIIVAYRSMLELLSLQVIKVGFLLNTELDHFTSNNYIDCYGLVTANAINDLE